MISLIITVYNKAPFLRRCLASVYIQRDKSAQIIVVDDGSTDGSEKICDEYEKLGFEVYHIKHGGVSVARNYGMDKAEGDYITFLDADDLLTPNALENMKAALWRGYNIYQFGQYRCRIYDLLNYIPHCSPKGSYSFGDIPRYWVYVWNKLYKKEFLDKNKIRFKRRMEFGEDALFNAKCILANNGLYHASPVTVIHCLDDKESLTRGDSLSLERINLLDKELCTLRDKQTDGGKKAWLELVISQHRASKIYRKYGFGRESKGKYDVVYFVKDAISNEELRYSLRSVDANWPHRYVWFCGGQPDGLVPDRQFNVVQDGLNKWDNVRNMIWKVCQNDKISEDFWLFNDDFYVLKPAGLDVPPCYNGELIPYIERVERKQGHADDYTNRLREAEKTLREAGLTTYNYEVHKPLLINRKKALEVLNRFPDTPAFRSLYGNYWKIGGESKHDMKVKVLKYPKMYAVENDWEFLSTSDTSFREGTVGEFVRKRFNKRSRFEK